MRATLFTCFAVTALLSGTALATSPTIPPAALNPAATSQALSVDNKLSNDTGLDNDAETLAGVEGQAPAHPAEDKVNNDHMRIDQLTQQLKHDTTYRADKATIKNDKTNIINANKQLKLDQKACQADLKANSGQISSQLQTTICK